MMMQMYFHFRLGEPILLQEWTPKNMTGYVFTCIGVAAIAVVYEVVKFSRSGVEKKANAQKLCGCHLETAALHKVTPAPGMPCGTTSANRRTELPFLPSNLGRSMHSLSSIIYFVQMFMAYSLMMISMTYNVPIFLSMVLGHIVAYFFLGPLISIRQYERLGDCCG
ncbi:unnamed protein product [Cylicocyclus nassatus]|uniref:Copper transport protein n=1 Tax=Cylicocyclus nassatus TaxID=53992 RepID=A0AA36GJV7_CYLNA|nr:unnamed protein product [Cylicocyclus nassatus]